MGMNPLHPVINGRKVCTKCGENKSLSEYGKCSGTKSGVMARCLECVRAYNKQRLECPKYREKFYAQNNEAKRKARAKQPNKPPLKGRPRVNALGFIVTPWSVSATTANRRNDLRKRMSGGGTFCEAMRYRRWSPAYRPIYGTAEWLRACTDQEHSDWCSEVNKPWMARGLSASSRDCIRRNCDVHYGVKKRVQIRLRMVMSRYAVSDKARRKMGFKTSSVFKSLGYTPADLAKHLESKFSEGMDWECFSRGEIHIDHIKPCVAFDLTDPVQVKECWALENLQPLWARDNWSKNSQWNGVLVRKE